MAEDEITPEMIDAGVDAFCLWDPHDVQAETIVRSVYSAMRAKAFNVCQVCESERLIPR